MNLSGKAVRHWLTELKIEIENCLVIVDDLALPLETLRMRKKGSDAGHNGLKNIQDLLQTQNYPRLRVGIGDNFSKGKQVDFVLGEFDKNEAKEEKKMDKLRLEVVLLLELLNGRETEFNMNLLANVISIYMAIISEGDSEFHAKIMKNVIETMTETFEKGAEL